MKEKNESPVLVNVSIVICRAMSELEFSCDALACFVECGETSVRNARKGMVKDRRINDRIARAFFREYRAMQGTAAAHTFLRDYLDAYSRDVFGLPLSDLLPQT